MISSSKETKANPGLELMRGKSQSLHDLKRKVNEPDSDKLLPMADKIDDFLRTIKSDLENVWTDKQHVFYLFILLKLTLGDR